MKQCFFIVFVYLNFGVLAKVHSQQNLVPNNSFEDTIPSSLQSRYLEDFVENWRGGFGYYNINKPNWYGAVPVNKAGYQYPHTGDSYCGIYTYVKYSAPLRQFIQTRLIQKLQTNRKYRVSFYVSLGDTLHANTNSIGAYFSVDSFFVSYGSFGGVLNYTPQIQNIIHNDLSSKINWTFICDTFVANGTEEYITIGNFYNDSLSNITLLDSVCYQPNGYGCAAYYYIDDVSVELIDETGLFNSATRLDFKIFPNPSIGNFTLQYDGVIKQPIVLSITDVYGKQFDKMEIVNNITNYKNTSLSKGLYFYSLNQGSIEIGRGKIVVVK